MVSYSADTGKERAVKFRDPGISIKLERTYLKKHNSQEGALLRTAWGLATFNNGRKKKKTCHCFELSRVPGVLNRLHTIPSEARATRRSPVNPAG